MPVEHAETEKAMLEAQEKEQQLANENAALDHINTLKEKMMATCHTNELRRACGDGIAWQGHGRANLCWPS